MTEYRIIHKPTEQVVWVAESVRELHEVYDAYFIDSGEHVACFVNIWKPMSFQEYTEDALGWDEIEEYMDLPESVWLF